MNGGSDWAFLGTGKLHGSDEAIALAWNGFNKDRIVGAIIQRRPQLHQCGVQAAVKFDKGALWPDFAAQILSGKNVSPGFEKKRENAKGLFLEFYGAALAR